MPTEISLVIQVVKDGMNASSGASLASRISTSSRPISQPRKRSRELKGFLSSRSARLITPQNLYPVSGMTMKLLVW